MFQVDSQKNNIIQKINCGRSFTHEDTHDNFSMISFVHGPAHRTVFLHSYVFPPRHTNIQKLSASSRSINFLFAFGIISCTEEDSTIVHLYVLLTTSCNKHVKFFHVKNFTHHFIYCIFVCSYNMNSLPKELIRPYRRRAILHHDQYNLPNHQLLIEINFVDIFATDQMMRNIRSCIL